jgi:hypothetical protein
MPGIDLKGEGYLEKTLQLAGLTEIGFNKAAVDHPDDGNAHR